MSKKVMNQLIDYLVDLSYSMEDMNENAMWSKWNAIMKFLETVETS